MKIMNSGKLFFAGDVVLKTQPLLSAQICEIIEQSDIVSCNFEAPIMAYGKAVEKAGPHLAQLQEAPAIVEKLGFNLINLANNHIHDYGDEALIATIKSFKNSQTVGAGDMHEAYSLKTFLINDTVIGFLSFCENGFGALTGIQKDAKGYAWINHPQVNEIIKTSKNNTDILIIQAHAGVEQVNVPLPEWRQRYKELIDCGADAIIAHHPHVPQGWELYNEKPIFYSLGNFYFDYDNRHPLWNTGLIVTIDFENKKIKNWNIHVVKKVGNNIDIIDNQETTMYLQHLNNLLLDPQYTEEINKAALILWDNAYKYYYENAFNGISNYSPYRLLKHIKRMLFMKKTNYTMLWHNLFIESNKWMIDRAISLKTKI